MRIISKVREYYDGVQGIDLEKSDVWCRERETVDPWETLDINNILKTQPYAYESDYDAINKIFSRRRRDSYVRNYTLHFILFGFCGKIYPMIIAVPDKEFSTYGGFKKLKNDVVIRSYDGMVSFLSETKPKDKHIDMNMFSTFFNTEYTFLNEVFIKLHVPYFSLQLIGKTIWLETNPDLTALYVKEQYDAYTIYQEISMYLFGVLGSKEDIPPMSNESIKQAHGFDHKYAFKKEPKNKTCKRPK